MTNTIEDGCHAMLMNMSTCPSYNGKYCKVLKRHSPGALVVSTTRGTIHTPATDMWDVRMGGRNWIIRESRLLRIDGY